MNIFVPYPNSSTSEKDGEWRQPSEKNFLNRRLIMSKQYIPKPIDVSDVVLPETWSDLIETLSANAHDI